MTIRLRAETENLRLILEGDGKTGLTHAWACRGDGKGCKRNTFRKRSTHCDDCMGPLPPDMTLEQVRARLDHGDA
jgi:hypothetical protein